MQEYALDIIRVCAIVPIDVIKRIDRLAKKEGKTRSQFIAEILAARVVGVSLTDKDREEIADYIEEARKRRLEKRQRG